MTVIYVMGEYFKYPKFVFSVTKRMWDEVAGLTR